TGNELQILPGGTAFAFVQDITVSTYTLFWTKVGGGVLSYVVEVSDVEDFSNIITSYQEPGDENNFVLVSGITYGTTYFNRIRVLYQSGDASVYSETLEVTTGVDPNTALDSLALVSIYQSTGGSQWHNSDNWLKGRLETWQGVVVEDARVTRLELNGNNLTGKVDDITSGLSALLVMDLSENELAGLGEVSSLVGLQNADVSENRLSFGAFQSLRTLGAEVIYDNQKELLDAISVLVEQGEQYVLDREVSGDGNVYRWFKNDELIAANRSRIFLDVTSFDQEGTYRAEVTNPDFPDLTLSTTGILLKVSSLERDRASLLAVYDATMGSGWTNGADWPNNPNIDTWVGVVVEGDRVVSLDLSNSNLIGDVPYDLLDIVNLRFLDLSGNFVTGIPDLRRMEELTAPNVSDNLLDFRDLESNAQVPSINYQNQKPVGEATEIRLPKGSNHVVTIPVGGTANVYQWLFDGFLDSREISGSTAASHEIKGLDYLRMGDYYLRVTNPLVPGLELITQRQTVLATTEVSFRPTYVDGNGSLQDLDQGEGFLMEVTRPGTPFDTIQSVAVDGQGLRFDDVVLGNYLVALRTDSVFVRISGGLADSVRLLPTYYSSAFLWEEADTLRIRDRVEEPLRMQRRPTEVETGGNSINLLVEADFATVGAEGARLEARRTVKRAGCSLRRRRRATGGRAANDLADFELIAYRETDDDGRVTFGELPDGDYRLDIDYPGIPMDPNSFITFTIGEGGLEQNTLTLEATIDETGIEVQLIEILRVLREYFEEIAVYPNPADRDLNIAYKGLTSSSIKAQLLNLQGMLLEELSLPRSTQKSVTLDVQDLSPGIYLLRMVDASSAEGILVFKVLIDR
ncbi:MAG: T9SS type A sorting domain-containing protein, partial [Bacteroidota bacterium]